MNLTVKELHSADADPSHRTEEQPTDEPDGGKKKDIPVKHSQEKKRIGFNLQGNSAASEDSVEENILQKQMER